VHGRHHAGETAGALAGVRKSILRAPARAG
jgi:hypothetical protein